jgi:Dolichyl-phosphate-mannose-protein mannosyltransferase
MIAQLLRDFAALFVVTGPGVSGGPDSAGNMGSHGQSFASARTGADSRSTLWLLACIVLAGAAVRFWGLGAVGLHGDEKTMALPVMNLVEHGSPLMPSGMFYPRAVAQLYMMATSVLVFGQSEWALRLPSALCGVLLIVLTWKVGARFLTPLWNLALTAAVAFLPSFIEDAQTARMYVFLVTCVAGYMALIFAWERTDRMGYLVAAVGTLLVGIQFHTLAIFAAFLVFMPGLLQGDSRKFRAGMLAFAAIVVGFEAINTWIGHAYPQSVESGNGAVANGPHAAVVPHLKHLWLLMAAFPALAFSFWALARRGILAALLLAGALVAEIALAWHLAALLLVAALVFARRVGVLDWPRLAIFFVVSVAAAVAEVAYLVQHAAGSLKQIAGVMLGWPSVWPFISIADYSTIAMLAAAGALACGLWLVAHRRPAPDHLLLLVLGVWVPLLMIGFIKWNIPSRYAAAQIMPLLVAAFAAMQWAAGALALRGQRVAAGDTQGHARSGPVPGLLAGGATPTWISCVAVLACLLVVNPLQVVAAVDSGYANHPDHKGAAEFVAGLHPGPRDIIVAEDVLQQTYYLGHVDYWLVNKQVAAPFMHSVNGRWLDFYTDTPLIGSGVELERLVEKPNRGAIYVIGSGENQEDGRSLMRAFGISQALQSPPFRLVYRGRDGFTEVWQVDAPSPTVSSGR